MHPGEEIDTGRDHGRGVDQSADRRGAGHGVGKPGLQRQLRRLADGAAEKQGGGGDGRADPAGHCAAARVATSWISSVPSFVKISSRAHGQGRVADPRGDESLRCRPTFFGSLYQKPIREIAAEPDALPSRDTGQAGSRPERGTSMDPDEEIHRSEEPAVPSSPDMKPAE